MILGGEKFIQIPGPNPILIRGGKKTWDEKWIECCDILKDYETYYLYYHGTPLDKKAWPIQGYRIGVATASHPLGPWRKYDRNPILDLGKKGSWEDSNIACAFIIKEGTDKYYMWYSANGGKKKEKYKWSIGLAIASSPLGPWKKHKDNPVLEDFGYVGGVVKVKDTYYMYSEYPIGSTGPDYGPIALATAKKPEGPWTKYTGNPVALREKNPDASAFAEVHSLFEPPFIYLYHTLRYISKPEVEDIGVQILAKRIPFSLAMPVLNISSVKAGKITSLQNCPPISVGETPDIAITAECRYHTDAKSGMRIHIRSSYDGINYDTVDLYAFDNHFEPGGTARKTVEMNSPCGKPQGITSASLCFADNKEFFL